jgi:hypothetical protein
VYSISSRSAQSVVIRNDSGGKGWVDWLDWYWMDWMIGFSRDGNGLHLPPGSIWGWLPACVRCNQTGTHTQASHLSKFSTIALYYVYVRNQLII